METPRGNIIAVRCPDDEEDFKFYPAIEMDAHTNWPEEQVRVQWLDMTTQKGIKQAPRTKYFPEAKEMIEGDSVICLVRQVKPSFWQSAQTVELSAAEWQRVIDEMQGMDPLSPTDGPSPRPGRTASSASSQGDSSGDDEPASFVSPREGGAKRPRLPAVVGTGVLGAASLSDTSGLFSPPMSPPRSVQTTKAPVRAAHPHRCPLPTPCPARISHRALVARCCLLGGCRHADGGDSDRGEAQPVPPGPACRIPKAEQAVSTGRRQRSCRALCAARLPDALGRQCGMESVQQIPCTGCGGSASCFATPCGRQHSLEPVHQKPIEGGFVQWRHCR